jgi:nucleoid-associated protein YgaU
MGTLEKLGILVVVILVVVVGVVVITPKSTVDKNMAPPGETAQAPEPLEAPVQPAPGSDAAKVPGTDPWPSADGSAGTKSLPGADATQMDPAAQKAPQFRTAKIQDKDTLATIAKRELGSATRYQEILDANPGLNPAKLEKGKDIQIPLAAAPAPKSPTDKSPVDGTSPADKGSTAEKTYVVKSGDTLAEIAKSQLGASRRWPEIAKANEDTLHGSTALKVGMKLKIPASSGSAITSSDPASEKTDPAAKSDASASKPADGTSGAAGTAHEYVVKSGDSLWLIAKREMGSEKLVADLRSANADVLKGSDSLKVGMKLKIPAKR